MALLHFVWTCPPGVDCTAPPFRGQVSKGSKLCNWWFGKARGLINEIWVPWRNGWRWVGMTMPGRGAVSGCFPSGWSWQADLWDGVNCFVFFLSFENPWRLLAGCWSGGKFLAQLLQGWNYGPRGHICCEPSMRVSPDATHKQLLRLMMLAIAGNPLCMEYWWG